MRLLITGVVLGFLAQSALAFQENTVGGSQEPAPPPAANLETNKPALDPNQPQRKGLNLTVPELSLGSSSGTEVRIPGLGKVGVLPKLDFGLELLYGATEQQKVLPDKDPGGDMQIRGTIKHRF
jgi:hypothetical protein